MRMNYKEIRAKILLEKERLKSPNVILKNIIRIYDKYINYLFFEANELNDQKKIIHAKKIDTQIRGLLKKIYLQYNSKVSKNNQLLYATKNII